LQSARITLVAALAAHRETSPLLPVSKVSESGHRVRHPQTAVPGRKSLPARSGSHSQEGLGL